MNWWRFSILFLFIPFFATGQTKSVARVWNEVLLEGIRSDFARPTIHARNLFHISAAIYDAWAVYDESASTYFLGKDVHGYSIILEDFTFDKNEKEELQKEAICYAAFGLMKHRFAESPGVDHIYSIIDNLMDSLGYDKTFTDQDYTTGSAAALGNYIAYQVKLYGYQDGANERGNYINLYYEPVNDPLDLSFSSEPNHLRYPNRWQPLKFETFIDQSGHVIDGRVIDFLSPEWGDVDVFALSEEMHTELERDGDTYQLYYNPGSPPLIDSLNNLALEDPYKWGFSLVSIWSSHLGTEDGVIWDISPASIGNLNINDLPTDRDGYSQFYNLLEGGDKSMGYDLNPFTNLPYEEQLVKRGDYARVLAEFWADGPDSETPPGHWFVILNTVMDDPDFNTKWKGVKEISELEFDVKAYFTLGGAMHDAAVSSWALKGYYDYVRPVSAIRFLATRGQSSSKSLPNYDSLGIPLVDGLIALIESGDPLAGPNDEFVNEIKLYTWRGHGYIENPEDDLAGVGWIRAIDWWPYQRPSFVTPPFAGYVSGHSTYSRAAAEVLTAITGSEYFPGGVGEFVANKNEFLVFEEGPSEDVVLQWAKYFDASDQCSLSRIWGGIHPPCDDIPGRLMGHQIGLDAVEYASLYFGDYVLAVQEENMPTITFYPNPTTDYIFLEGNIPDEIKTISLYSMGGANIRLKDYVRTDQNQIQIDLKSIQKGIYFLFLNNRMQCKVIVID